MVREFKREHEQASDLSFPEIWDVLIGAEDFLRKQIEKQMTDVEELRSSCSSWDDDGSVDGESYRDVRAENEAHHQEEIRHTRLTFRVQLANGGSDYFDLKWGHRGFSLSFRGYNEVRTIGIFETTRRELIRLITAVEASDEPEPEPEPVSDALKVTLVQQAPAATAPIPWYQGPYAVQIVGGIISGLVVAVVVFLLLS